MSSNESSVQVSSGADDTAMRVKEEIETRFGAGRERDKGEVIGLNRSRPIGTGMWIRDHLLEHGKDYIYHMWKEFCEYLMARGYKPPAYGSFNKTIYILRRLGMIENVATEHATFDTAHDRVYVQLNEGMVYDDRWQAPAKAYNERNSRLSDYD